MEKETKELFIKNAIYMPNGLRVINLTSINLYFDDGFVLPKGNKEILEMLLPVPVKVKETIKGTATIETINYMPNELIFDEEFLDFIDDEDVYFLCSHITCNTYNHHRFIMTQVKYREDGRKLAYASRFTNYRTE